MDLQPDSEGIRLPCGAVSLRLSGLGVLNRATCPVQLLPDFDTIPEVTRNPALRLTYAFYRPKADVMCVNGTTFLPLTADVQEVVIAHETGHYAANHEPALIASLDQSLHPCQIADWLACCWGFGRALMAERLADGGYGLSYLAVLQQWPDPVAFSKAANIWSVQKTAGIV
jgi:hypothetical protein